jgi:ubiquinone/menaquinone biosynthesis C-methylase UbiE
MSHRKKINTKIKKPYKYHKTMFLGNNSFKMVGNRFIRYFKEWAQLQPHAKVLDIGCGPGRIAIPLTEYITSPGEYHGLDIVEEGITWCQEHISPKFPNFHFTQSDIFNKRYNPNGKYSASNYRFPFKDNYFDFIVLTSVFTHMLPEDIKNYLSEISRVLKPGGYCLITYFLLNDPSGKLIPPPASSIDFAFEIDGCFLTKCKDVPERAIAYREDFIKSLYIKNHLHLVEPIRYGKWSGKDDINSYQDIIIAFKQSS